MTVASATLGSAVAAREPAGNDLPRLLPGGGTTSLRDHLARWGGLPLRRDLLGELERAGLRGRGGAGFPTARKLLAVRKARGRLLPLRRPVVAANGTESEPASLKDRALLETSPHLVLDGMVAAADAVGADWGVLCVKHSARSTRLAVERALAERHGRDPVTIEVQTVPEGYVSGEASALVNWLTRGSALPTVTPPHASERGVDGSPTLVHNVETLANVALIARLGASWWRRVGAADDPGSALVTLSGPVARPGVYEIPLGLPLTELLGWAGSPTRSAVLLGGYYGTWITGEQAEAVRLDRADLERHGASFGCGVVAVLGADTCPIAEVARVARWLAGQSAGQCGPCVNGLPALAGAVEALVAGDRVGSAEHGARRWAAMVEGRGACGLPDGAVRFLRSSLDVFSGHIELHRRFGPCRPSPTVLPVPGDRRTWR